MIQKGIKKDIDYLPFEGPIIIVGSLVLFQCFLAVEKLLTVLDGTLKKHSKGYFNFIVLKDDKLYMIAAIRSKHIIR
jgi:hypothetical protein